MKIIQTQNLLAEKKVARAKALSFSQGDVMNLQIKAGEKVARHHTPCDAIVVIIKGKVLFTGGDEQVDVKPGMFLHLDPGEEHELEGVEDASLLVVKVGGNTSCTV
ncbi:cupin domain-containing protein [Aneurinibacillus terranovensis]|uniref:cupin domain-containing protein n=1 Tax=Aneurinibacillus terranovensis TaxID=278991 RepID=UPI00040D5F1F|nr:cupin domain-containing protein [Aneurinibacillus terranovensis]